MTLTSITKVENSARLLVTILLVMVVIYLAIMTPLFDQNKQLQDDIKIENELSLYLDTAQQQLSIASQYPVISLEQANQIIGDTFQAQGVTLDSLNINNETSITNIKIIPFSQLLETLQQLKDQHGVVVTKAIIEIVEPGLVSAQLTFSNPSR
jgi:type II secretory pathway component PulM|tara:strand:+ start:678 stop:1136 length:459 start_codon:yes stop_codon:yes gene_type:complete